jgi:hypothetical protein
VFKLAETVAGKCKSALSLAADEHFGAALSRARPISNFGTGRNLIYRRGIVRARSEYYSAAASTFFFRRQQQQQLFCSFSMLLDLFYKHETTSRIYAACLARRRGLFYCTWVLAYTAAVMSLLIPAWRPAHTKILRAQKMVYSNAGPTHEHRAVVLLLLGNCKLLP